jgi:phosphoserine aminotransferase
MTDRIYGSKEAMTEPGKPEVRPANLHFSSGPCAKPPGWSRSWLKDASLGRSHRAPDVQAKIALALAKTRRLLKLPEDYLIAVVPASDTGAVEMALWSLLGPRGVDVLAWEAFGQDWVRDIVEELKLPEVRALVAPYGSLPDLGQADFSRDVVFAWNGTSSGVRVPNGDWIAADREGLIICDASSAVFAQDIDWRKLDAVTFSWQKVLGGEAQHGMLILSPRAVERLESHSPSWPMPKLFRMTEGGTLKRELFEGWTINTPSMLAVEDYLAALAWAESVGGLEGMMARSDANADLLADWVARTDWVEFLAQVPETRSNTSACLVFADPEVRALPLDVEARFAAALCACLAAEDVARDIGAYRHAPPGLRIWTGATIERADLAALLPWLDWAFAETKKTRSKADYRPGGL